MLRQIEFTDRLVSEMIASYDSNSIAGDQILRPVVFFHSTEALDVEDNSPVLQEGYLAASGQLEADLLRNRKDFIPTCKAFFVRPGSRHIA